MPKNIPKKCVIRKSLNPICESLRIVLPYVVLGCLWIFFSDSLLNLASDAQGMVLISNIKGWAFVAVTAALLWALVYSRVKEVKVGQTELADSEARFRLLVEGAPDAVFVHVGDSFVYANARTLELLGVKQEEELFRHKIYEFMPEDQREAMMEKISQTRKTGKAQKPNEEAILRADGTLVDVEVSTMPVRYCGKDGTLVFMRDITERKQYERNRFKLELQLRQKHRLESIGTLASGIAHEINNPITGIINYAQLITDYPSADEQLREYSGEIMREGLRVADTVKNLMSFSQVNRQARTPNLVSQIVDQTISLTEMVLRHDQIDLAVNVADDLPVIKCCAQQIQQVLMNLITNARDALNARYSGFDENKKLTVSAALTARDGQPWIRFIVEDRGIGIREDLLPKLFDPFFTTSMRSEHAGLGLSICLGIVKEHHGDIWFETQEGEFTRAIVELPVDGSVLI